MKVNFRANWTKAFQQGIKRGSLLLQPIGANQKNLAEFLNKLDGWQGKEAEKNPGATLRPLDVTIEVHYKQRTLKMNNLMWSLYDVMANELNQGVDYRDMTLEQRKHAVSAEDLYNADIHEHAPIFVISVPPEHLPYIKETYRDIISIEESQDMCVVKGRFTTSHMNTHQMSKWIDRIFVRLAEMGVKVEKGSDVVKYWEQYATVRPIDTETLYTIPQYKKLHPFCEACTKYLADGGGSYAHIEARGMGRNPMEYKITEADGMHLCDVDHALYDNGMGRDVFIKKYPHLKNKIESRLNRQLIPENK